MCFCFVLLTQQYAQVLCKQTANEAPVAELVDALDSKSSSGNRVRVRVSLGAPFLVLLEEVDPRFSFEQSFIN